MANPSEVKAATAFIGRVNQETADMSHANAVAEERILAKADAGVTYAGPTGPTGVTGAGGATGPTGAVGFTGPAGP